MAAVGGVSGVVVAATVSDGEFLTACRARVFSFFFLQLGLAQ